MANYSCADLFPDKPRAAWRRLRDASTTPAQLLELIRKVVIVIAALAETAS
ncbi:MAG TPA: hypothetical protein VKP30_07775 [Polyangiaceae bacterium]|nr:hypothetical protein [Polyangiaceae bacterium]